MQPRGQLWFALERICQDFRTCSGLKETEALEILVVVLTNMLAEQRGELEKLTSPSEVRETGESIDAIDPAQSPKSL